MKLALSLLIGLFSFTGNAQTDIIEFRSHSGNISYFTVYAVKSIDGICTNFGMAPMRTIRTAALDTVKYLSNGKSVMVTSNYCSVENQMMLNLDGQVVPGLADLWNAGSDTMDNHPLFSHPHSLDSIKQVLANAYNFRNSIDSVVFIGYDNLIIDVQKGKETELELKGIPPAKKDKGGFGLGILISLLTPFLFLYLAGPFLFKWVKNN